MLGGARSRAQIDELLSAVSDIRQIRLILASAQATEVRNGQPPTSSENADGSGAGTGLIFHPPHHEPRLASTDVAKYRPSTDATAASECPAKSNHESLQFENGYGGFSADGREYLIRLAPDGRGGHRRPPMPWTNVIANEQAGFLVTESGAGYTWSGNSRLNRLTAWHNDPVCDPHSEAVWIRDDDARVFWSPTPGPTPAASEYLVRHGFGYTVFEHTSHELSQELTMFMARDEPVKLTRLRLVNQSGRTRRLSLFSYLHWALGGLAGETASAITTTYCGDEPAIRATNPNRERYAEHVAFSSIAVNSSTPCDTSYSCDRASFLGPQ